MSITVPPYDKLPVRPGAPAGSAWGVFDKDGKRDALGALNFITPGAVVAAKSEIQTGESVALNLPLHLPYIPCPGRVKVKHTYNINCHGMLVCEDELVLNTQSSSQWDGLLHYAHQARGEFYNGVSYADAAELRTDVTLGIQAISDRGGIVGRGVLLDFVRYAAKRGVEYDPLGDYAISLNQIKEMIAEEGLTIRQGDILIVRSGLSKWMHESTAKSAGPWEAGTHVGVDPTPEFIAWVWNQNLGAVAGDAIAFESVPASDKSFMRFHEAAIAGWGMNIGEMFDLEHLSVVAEKNRRWSFFLTVCPLNIRGGAATVANTLAIF